MRRIIALLFLAALPGHALAERATAPNGMSAAGAGDRIEVFSSVSRRGGDYFCAAGSLARRLGAGATDRVTITHALSPSLTRQGQRSVIFRLSAPGGRGGWRGVFLTPHRTGASLTVGHALSLCNS